MDARRWSATSCSLVLSGLLTVLAPGPSVGGQMWQQQAILLVHLPQAGGQFFTTNHFISASEQSADVNIKCFNDASQRVGSADGGTLPLASAGPGGRTALVTALSLQVTMDPLFTGIGWCWANNVLNEAGFNVETVLGLTPSPSTILGSSNPTFVAANAGLTATSSGRGDMPIFFVGGGTQNFLILVNPLTTDRILTLQLYDPDGVPLGPPLVRPLNGRGMQVLSVPQAFGVFPLRPSGSVTMAANGNGYLGWIVQVQPPTTLLFTAIGLKVDDLTLLTRPSAP